MAGFFVICYWYNDTTRTRHNTTPHTPQHNSTQYNVDQHNTTQHWCLVVMIKMGIRYTKKNSNDCCLFVGRSYRAAVVVVVKLRPLSPPTAVTVTMTMTGNSVEGDTRMEKRGVRSVQDRKQEGKCIIVVQVGVVNESRGMWFERNVIRQLQTLN